MILPPHQILIGMDYQTLSLLSLKGRGGSRLTHFLFDNNGSYEDNTTGVTIERGLFYENPKIQILDKRNLTGGGLGNLEYDSETLSNYIRLNDKVDYDPEADRSFLELYVDDRFPEQLYYGVGVNTGSDQVLPAFGGEILVMDSIPGYTWANNEASYKPRYSYADQDGYYAFPNLEPGLYNIAVFFFRRSKIPGKYLPPRRKSNTHIPDGLCSWVY